MTTDIVKATRMLPSARNAMAETVAREIERFVPVLPAHVDVDQMLSALVVAANELEKECSPKSVMMSALACCTMGLMPGKTLGLAYFVPFKGECTLIPGYRGYTELAFRNRFLKAIHADVVYDGEEFDYWTDETGPRLMHKPSLDRDVHGDRVVAAYCVSQLESGGRQIRVMNRKELAAVDKGEKVWAQHKHEMWLKTVIRRAAKHWRLTRELAQAIRLDEQAEREEPQDLGAEFGDVTPAEPRHRKRTLNPEPAPEPDTSGADAEAPETGVATWADTLVSLNEAAMDAGLGESDLTARVNLWLIAAGAKGKEDKKTTPAQRAELVKAVRDGRLGADGKVA